MKKMEASNLYVVHLMCTNPEVKAHQYGEEYTLLYKKEILSIIIIILPYI